MRWFRKPMFCNPMAFVKTTVITKTTKTIQTASNEQRRWVLDSRKSQTQQKCWAAAKGGVIKGDVRERKRTQSNAHKRRQTQMSGPKRRWMRTNASNAHKRKQTQNQRITRPFTRPLFGEVLGSWWGWCRRGRRDVFFCFSSLASLFFVSFRCSLFFFYSPRSLLGQEQTTAIYWENDEFHSEPVSPTPVRTSRPKMTKTTGFVGVQTLGVEKPDSRVLTGNRGNLFEGL